MGGNVALLLAAGAGVRLGREPKAFAELGGAPLLVHSLRTMASCREIDRMIIVVPDGYAEAAMECAASVERSHPASPPIEATVGGSSRQESVRLGLGAATADAEIVICHDAARPFATAGLFRRVLAGVVDADGAVPVIPIPDTVKRISAGRVVETLPREEIWLVQTPQAFAAAALRRSHELAVEEGLEATDDAMLLEAAGFEVAAVEGEPTNFKVTTPEDFMLAERLLAEGMAAGRLVDRPGAGRVVDRPGAGR